jgi:type IV pilus assembly protein PilA
MLSHSDRIYDILPTPRSEEANVSQRIRNGKGFTLVELMIVVAIIGILAAIAIPNFLNFRLKAKTSEAKSNLGAIRTSEVAYFAEWNWYVGNQPLVPIANRASQPDKSPWVSPVMYRFSILGFAPEGNVYFSYNLEGNAFNSATDGFTSNAVGDLDGDGQTSTYTMTNITTEIQKTGAPY